MKVYYSPGSCSLASHIICREAGIPIELERVHLKTKLTTNGGFFLAINPKGYVPALTTDEGILITEGAAVLQYLADRAPEAELIPRVGTFERYAAVEWIHFIATELHKSWSVLFDRAEDVEHKRRAREKITLRLAFVQTQLQRTQFLLGDRFTVADAYLYTILRWAPLTNVALTQRLTQYVEAIAARPAVQLALAAEGLAPRVDSSR